MQNKKLIITSFLFLSFAIVSQAQNIYFKFINSTYSQYALSDLRSITYSANNMNLNMVSGTTIPLQISTISSFNYNGFNGNTDVTNLTEHNEVLIYPNPSNGTITINYNALATENVIIEFLTITGELLNSITQQNIYGNNTLTLTATDNQGKDLPIGIYLCRILTKQNAINKKIIINK